jgi:hypothetical protein
VRGAEEGKGEFRGGLREEMGAEKEKGKKKSKKN